MCPVARLHACSQALVLPGARPARCVSRRVPGEAWPGGAGGGGPRRGRAPPRAEAVGRARPPAGRNRAGGARRTVTAPPLIAHAECAAIAPYSCRIRKTAPGKARNSRREIAVILLVPEAENG